MKKGKYVPIENLDELVGVFNNNCRFIHKHLSKLYHRNRKLTILSMAALGLAVWSEVERRKQEEQVYQLSVRVKKLEQSEEE